MVRNAGLAALYGALLCLALPLHPGVFLGLIAASTLLLLAQPALADGPHLKTLAAWTSFVVATLVSAVFAADWQRAMLVSLSLAPALALGFLLATRLTVSNLQHIGSVLTLTGMLLSLNLLRIALLEKGTTPANWLELSGYMHLSVPNDLLILVFLLVFTINLLYFYRDSRAHLLLVSIAFAFQFLTLVIYQSRGGLILATTAVILTSVLRKHGWQSLIPAAALLFFLAEGLSGFALTQKLLATSTLSARVPLWMAAWSMFLDAPWLGQGPGAFSLLYPQYLAAITLPDWVVMDPRHMPWAHNLYLELLAERGLIGLGAFVAAIVLTLQALLGNRVWSNHPAAAYARVCVLSCGALLLAGGLFEFSLLRFWLLVLLGVIGGFALRLQDKSGRK